MSEQEHEQQTDETTEEFEETIKDLDVPKGEADEVKGGDLPHDVAKR